MPILCSLPSSPARGLRRRSIASCALTYRSDVISIAIPLVSTFTDVMRAPLPFGAPFESMVLRASLSRVRIASLAGPGSALVLNIPVILNSSSINIILPFITRIFINCNDHVASNFCIH
ncbi:MAG: hypothetical protein C00003105_00844 [ANME-2 cluster archaeon HR1]|nr:MAG: hypothetical protein C00003105_00844 [ANME-2 cluster archaeon HR1]